MNSELTYGLLVLRLHVEVAERGVIEGPPGLVLGRDLNGAGQDVQRIEGPAEVMEHKTFCIE